MRNAVTLPRVESNATKNEANDNTATNYASASAVIRARYEPDVRGVNRYKHFHRPLTGQENCRANGGLGMFCAAYSGPSGESIDKKISPRSPRNSSLSNKTNSSPRHFITTPTERDLPFIETTEQLKCNHSSALQQQLLNNNHASRANIQSQQAPPIDTWRIRRRPTTGKEHENSPALKNEINAMETLLTMKQPQTMQQRSIQSDSNIGVLPDIRQRLGTADSENGSTETIDGKKCIIRRRNVEKFSLQLPTNRQIDQMLPSPTTTVAPEIGIATRQNLTEVQKTNDNSSNKKNTNSNVLPKNPFSSTTRQKTSETQKCHKLSNNEKDDSLNESKQFSPFPHQSTSILKGDSDAKRIRTPKIRTKEFGTQTNEMVATHRSSELNPMAELPSRLPTVRKSSHQMQKATQTESSLDYFTAKITNFRKRNTTKLEECTELLKLIDTALEETIDKQSRLLANQFIASSARKQAEVWRDAKEFVLAILVPHSIEMANRARTSRIPLEHVAKIQLP